MLDLVSDILKSPAGSFAFIFAFLMLAFFLVYKFSHFNTKFGSVEKLENNVDKIKDDISSIKGFMEVFRTHNNPFAKANSPISLTPVGIEVSKDLEIEKLVISHWEDIIKMFSDKLIKNSNPYDIQVCSIKIGGELLKSLSENELNTIKTYAYSKGHSLSYYDVLFGVVIRDHYFKIKGIDLSEIDKHDAF
jgi:hypothetical protein